MFQTLEPYNERLAKTAIPFKRKVYFNSEDHPRPNTSALGKL